MTDDETRLANLAVLARYRDAWTAGDFAGLIGLYADDFILHWFGQNPLAGTYAGKQAAVTALLDFTRKTDRKLVAVSHIMADAQRGVMMARERLGGREVERVLIYRFAGDLMAECWVYDADQAYIDGLLGA